MTRKSVQEMKARDIMSRNLVTISPDEDVSSALGKMQQHDINELPVVDEKDRILGLVNYEALLKRRSIPMSTKVENVMAFPPRVRENDSVIDIAETMLSAGYRAVPVTDRDRVVGIVSRTDLVGIIPELRILRDIKVHEIMTASPQMVHVDDTVEQARSLMYKLDVRALPVVDDRERLVGVVGLKDIGKASFRKRDRMTRGDASGDAHAARIRVGSIMNTPPITISRDQSLLDAVNLMKEHNISTVIVTEGDRVEGIVTQYDLIELIASFKDEERMFVQISGLHEADPEAYDMMYDLIQKRIKRIAKLVTPKVFSIHVSEHDPRTGGEPSNVSIRGRLTTEHEMYYSTATDWDLMRALSEMLSNMERSIRRDKEKKQDMGRRQR